MQIYNKNLTYLQIDYPVNGKILNAIGKCSRLTTLKLGFLDVDNPNYYKRISIPKLWKVDKLKNLQIEVCDEDINLITNILNVNPHLEHLSLVDLHSLEELLDEENKQYEQILKSCPNITKLHLKSEFSISTKILLLLPCYSRNLTHLELFFDDSYLARNDYKNLLSNLQKLKFFKTLNEELTLNEVSFYF